MLISICSAPTFVTVKHGSNKIFRGSPTTTVQDPDVNILEKTGPKMYAFDSIVQGNPLEILSVGTPNVSFNWNGPYSMQRFTDGDIAYSYLGVMFLPFVGLGLIFGRSPWKERLFLVFMIVSTIILLSAFSPTFALLLAWPSPLRSVRHYSDTSFRLGINYVMILIAGLGLEVIFLQCKKYFWKPYFLTLFVLSLLLSFTFIIIAPGHSQNLLHLFNEWIVSFFILMTFFGTIFTLTFLSLKDQTIKRGLIVLFFFFIFIDISQNAFYYVRFRASIWYQAWNSKTLPAEPNFKEIGFDKGDPRTVIANTILTLKLPNIKSSFPEKYLALLGSDSEYFFDFTDNGFEPESYYCKFFDGKLRNFQLDIDANFSDAGGGIWLRSKIENGKVSGVLLAAENGWMSWRVYVDGKQVREFNALPMPELSKKIHLKIVVFGNKYNLYINDNPNLRMRIIDNLFSQGEIRLNGSTKKSSRYHYIKIRNDFLFPGKNVKILKQTYNKLNIEVTTEKQQETLFWNDAYFPFWKSYVNGKDVEIMKIDNGKGVVLPKGISNVLFIFKPPYISFLYLLSYIIIFILLIYYVLILILTKRKKLFD